MINHVLKRVQELLRGHLWVLWHGDGETSGGRNINRVHDRIVISLIDDQRGGAERKTLAELVADRFEGAAKELRKRDLKGKGIRIVRENPFAIILEIIN